MSTTDTSRENDQWVSIVPGETYNSKMLKKAGLSDETITDLKEFYGLRALGRGTGIFRGETVIESLERMDRGELVVSCRNLTRDEVRDLRVHLEKYFE